MVLATLVTPEHFFVVVLVLNLAKNHLAAQSPGNFDHCVVVLKFRRIIEAVICEDDLEVFFFEPEAINLLTQISFPSNLF